MNQFTEIIENKEKCDSEYCSSVSLLKLKITERYKLKYIAKKLGIAYSTLTYQFATTKMPLKTYKKLTELLKN